MRASWPFRFAVHSRVFTSHIFICASVEPEISFSSSNCAGHVNASQQRRLDRAGAVQSQERSQEPNRHGRRHRNRKTNGYRCSHSRSHGYSQEHRVCVPECSTQCPYDRRRCPPAFDVLSASSASRQACRLDKRKAAAAAVVEQCFTVEAAVPYRSCGGQ